MKWYWKLLYAAGAYAAILLVVHLAFAVSGYSAQGVGVVLDLSAVIFGARIFRGKSEDIIAPRTWWRMTSKPTLSRRLGILAVIWTVVMLLGLAFTAAGLESRSAIASQVDLVFEYLCLTFEGTVLAYLYLNSASRLRKLDAAARERDGVIPRVFDRSEDHNHHGPTERVRVTEIVRDPGTKISETAERDGIWRLVRVVGDAGDAIAVYVDDHVIGSLSGPKAARYSNVLDALGSPLVVNGLRTGDRLWVDLPTLSALPTIDAVGS